MRTDLPPLVGKIPIAYYRGDSPITAAPFADRSWGIRLSPLGRPVFHVISHEKLGNWMLYSHTRQYGVHHPRAYYCVGEEDGEPFVARISPALWNIYEARGVNGFVSDLKPYPITVAEQVLHRPATLHGNMWTIHLSSRRPPKGYVMDRFSWWITPRKLYSAPLFGMKSGWMLERGIYARIRDEDEPVAVVDGRIASDRGRRIFLDTPHLVGLVPGWHYCLS